MPDLKGETPMPATFFQMAEEEMSAATAVSAEEALQILADHPDALLVDVRDKEEVAVTGKSPRAVNAPGRSIAWLADLEVPEEYQEPELQDRSRKILTTCGSSPAYRGASAANLLARMGFADVVFVDGGMAALLEAGIEVE